MNNGSITDRLKIIYSRRLNLNIPPDRMPDDFSLRDAGVELDSIDSLEILVGLETGFDIRIEPGEISRETLESIPLCAAYIQERLEDRDE